MLFAANTLAKTFTGGDIASIPVKVLKLNEAIAQSASVQPIKIYQFLLSWRRN
jgi:hypothetical protein